MGESDQRRLATPGHSVVVHNDGDGFRFNVLDDDGTVLSSSRRFDSADAAEAGFERARRIITESEPHNQGDGGV